MRKFNGLCAVIVTFTIAIFVITLGQNVVARTSGFYSYYFNDANNVVNVTSEVSSEEVAEKIAKYMNSWSDEPFQISEYTGYDYQGIFTDDESYNMMMAQRLLRKSMVICIVSFVISFSIMLYFILKRYRVMARVVTAIASAFTVIGMVAQYYLITSPAGRQWISDRYGFFDLNEDCNLLALIGNGYYQIAASFFILITAVAIGGIFYICYRTTRPDRLFS